MLGFLRRIRRSLIEEGHLRKYLIYALGEVLLVMIGILLALQVNTWNDNRNLRNTESQIIAALNVEFIEARDALDFRIDVINSQRTVLLDILGFCQPGTVSLSQVTMDSLINSSYALPSFNPPNATLEDLINTGKISVIQNEELRKILSAWSGKLEEAKRQEEYQGAFLYGTYTPYIEQRIEFPYEKDSFGLKDNNEGSFGTDSRTLLRDFEFCNLTRRAAYWSWWVNEEYANLGEDIDRIVELTKQ